MYDFVNMFNTNNSKKSTTFMPNMQKYALLNFIFILLLLGNRFRIYTSHVFLYSEKKTCKFTNL